MKWMWSFKPVSFAVEERKNVWAQCFKRFFMRCTTIVNKVVNQTAEQTLLPVVQCHWFGSSHPYVTPLVRFPNFLTFYFLNPVLLFIQDQVTFRIQLFQKTLSERTVNGSCRTDCTTERNCGFHTWYAKTTSSSRGAKLPISPLI